MAYRFNGSSDYVQFAISPFNGATLGALTIAMLYKVSGGGAPSLKSLVGFGSASSTDIILVLYNGSAAFRGTRSGAASDYSVNLWDNSIWYLVVVTFPSGSGTPPRFHSHDGTSWTHLNGSGSVGSDATIGATDKLFVGTRGAGGLFFQGDLVCAGIKKVNATDLQVETLSRTAFSAWTGFGFDWLIGFDTSLVAGGLLQDQALPGSGDQNGISGTSVVADPPGWSWASTPAAPAPAFRAAGPLATSVTATTVVAYPAGVANGDLLVVQYCIGSGNSPSTPSGWTKLLGPVAGSDGGGGTKWVFYRIAGASEPSTVTFPLLGASSSAGIMAAYTGVDGTTPINAFASANLPGSGSSGTTPSVTTTVANTMLLRIYWGWVAGGTTITPAGTDTERFEASFAALGYEMELADSAQAAIGASGTTTATFSSGHFGGLGATIALAPAPAAAPSVFVPQVVVI